MRGSKEISSRPPLFMCLSSVFSYAGNFFLCLRAARAARPVPRSSMVAGSGVGVAVRSVIPIYALERVKDLIEGLLSTKP